MKNTFILFTLLLLMGCGSQGLPDTFDFGTIENGRYHNDYFGLSIDVPEDWHPQSKEEMKQLSDLGAEMVAGDDPEFREALKTSDINTAYLVSVFKYEVGALVDFNPSYMLVAENTSMVPGVRTGSDYLDQVKSVLLEASGVTYEFPEPRAQTVRLGGREFDVLDATMSYMGVEVLQTYYARIENGFALSAILSYGTEEDKQELMDLFGTLKFE